MPLEILLEKIIVIIVFKNKILGKVYKWNTQKKSLINYNNQLFNVWYSIWLLATNWADHISLRAFVDKKHMIGILKRKYVSGSRVKETVTKVQGFWNGKNLRNQNLQRERELRGMDMSFCKNFPLRH